MKARYADWPSRLAAAIDKAARTPFAWGRHDCCMAACDLVKAITGADPGRRLRGYRDRAGAARRLRNHAPAGTKPADRLAAVAEKLAAASGLAEVPPLCAQRGDVVLAETDVVGPRGRVVRGDVLGVVDLSGRTAVVAGPESGWALVPLAEIKRAWRV